MPAEGNQLRGAIARSKERGYHILGEDGVAYAVTSGDWKGLFKDYHVFGQESLLGLTVHFSPSARIETRHGLPYANNVIMPMDLVVKSNEYREALINSLQTVYDPMVVLPEEKEEE